MIPKAGDIVVYRERAHILGQDKIRRATFTGKLGEERTGRGAMTWIVYECTRDGERINVPVRDAIRIEPAQHGWTGTPSTSGAW